MVRNRSSIRSDRRRHIQLDVVNVSYVRSNVMRMKIECCHGCEKPKRYPGCQSHCEEYIQQRKELDEWNNMHYQQKVAVSRINNREYDRIYKARRRRDGKA